MNSECRETKKSIEKLLSRQGKIQTLSKSRLGHKLNKPLLKKIVLSGISPDEFNNFFADIAERPVSQLPQLFLSFDQYQ